MPRSIKCSYCGVAFPASNSLCPHCGLSYQFPNVSYAQAERGELEERYQAAKQRAKARGCEAVFEEFEKASSTSKAVMARSDIDTFRLAVCDEELYGSFYELLRTGLRLPFGEKWDTIRVLTDDALFPHYKDKIVFAALSLDGFGLSHYGNCAWVLKDFMIVHRATAFEENSVVFMGRYGIEIKGSHDLPKGYRSTWEERGKLSVTKLADKLAPDTDSARFPALLLKNASKREDDEFVEVHIFGSFSAHAFERVILQKKGSNVKLGKLRDKLKRVGVDLETV